MIDIQEVCERKRPGYQPPQFNLQFLLWLLGLSAIWAASFRIFDWGSLIVLAVIELTYLFGCSRTKKSVIAVVPAMYLPYGWLLTSTYPWNNYRWDWLGHWLQLPGLVAIFPFGNQSAETWLSGLLSSGFFLLAVTLGRINPMWRIASALTVLVLSILLSVAAYGMFSM